MNEKKICRECSGVLADKIPNKGRINCHVLDIKEKVGSFVNSAIYKQFKEPLGRKYVKRFFKIILLSKEIT